MGPSTIQMELWKYQRCRKVTQQNKNWLTIEENSNVFHSYVWTSSLVCRFFFWWDYRCDDKRKSTPKPHQINAGKVCTEWKSQSSPSRRLLALSCDYHRGRWRGSCCCHGLIEMRQSHFQCCSGVDPCHPVHHSGWKSAKRIIRFMSPRKGILIPFKFVDWWVLEHI